MEWNGMEISERWMELFILFMYGLSNYSSLEECVYFAKSSFTNLVLLTLLSRGR